MKGAIVRLAAVAGLFLLWLGYLAYLVVATPREPIILCRPQFLVSEIDVVATVTSPTTPATVVDVLAADDENARQLIGKEIEVTNLTLCGPPAHLQKIPNQKDFTVPGEYILPLRKVAGKEGATPTYEVVATPPAPGYPAPGPPRPGPPRIYPATAETRAQYKRLGKTLGAD